MRKYVFGTGIISAVITGMALLRSLRDEQFTWRAALAWLSWGITFALAIGAILDVRRASHGGLAPSDSPIAGREKKFFRKRVSP